MSTKTRLGRGLEALISKTPLTSGRMLIQIPIEEIRPNPFQPRTVFSEEHIQSLAESIKTHGLNHPLLVRKKDAYFELIAGERRLKAAQSAGLTSVPVIVKDVSDQESLELALIENTLREDLNAIDIANSYLRLIQDFQLSHEEIGKIFGKQRSTITNTTRLLNLSLPIQNMIKEGILMEGHGRALLGIESDAMREECLQLILTQQLSVRDAEKYIQSLRKPRKKPTSATNWTPDALKNILSQLSEKYQAPVEVKGSPKKGKLILHYASEDRLADLLQRLT